MLKKLRRALEEIRGQKFKHFDDFEKLITKIRREYGYLFPNFSENRNGNRYVYNFGVPEVNPISLEKEHGSRESVPRRYATFAIQGIEDVLTFIEVNAPDAEGTASEEDKSNENAVAPEETDGALPPPKIPDRDS